MLERISGAAKSAKNLEKVRIAASVTAS